jgi:LysR family glycine cleavage system transcriptional activator
MRFRSYHSLRFFDAVARHLSVSAAAIELNQSKGSVSYQIGKLESELGFKLFHRAHARLTLTPEGQRLWHVSQAALSQIDREIAQLRGLESETVTVGMLTYFSSRWLSPRLTRFFEAYPRVSLRIEPLSSIESLRSVSVDLAILWGIGDWRGTRCELLFDCPAVPTGNAEAALKIKDMGTDRAIQALPLLGDSSGDSGWRAWHEAAGLPYRPSRASLVVPDSNSRVQAVIDGQGLALWDRLVTSEYKAGKLVAVSETWLESSGYYIVYPKPALSRAAVAFQDWILLEARNA